MSRYARSFAALSVITLGVYAVLVTLGLRNLVVGDPPMQPFDLRLLGYSYFEATFYLEHLSARAVALYAGPLRVLDTVFPALMGLWLGWALWGLTRNVHAWSRVILMVVPGGYVIMDLAENALISEMLHHGAGAISGELVALASSYTVTKFLTLFVAFALLSVMIVFNVGKKRRGWRG